MISCNYSEKKNNSSNIKNDITIGYVSELKSRSINGDSRAFGELVDYYGRHPSKYFE